MSTAMGWMAAPIPVNETYARQDALTRDQPDGAFGQMLKQRREARGLSQSKVAYRAELTHSFISRLESSARMPDRDTVEALGAALALTAVEHDQLRAAAGFLPRNPISLIANEPVIGEVLNLLQDEAVPSEYRDGIRQQLQLIASQARFAVKVGGRAA